MKRKAAFTLTELLVVIAVIAFLAHAEIHHWQDPATVAIGPAALPAPENADTAWLERHATLRDQ